MAAKALHAAANFTVFELFKGCRNRSHAPYFRFLFAYPNLLSRTCQTHPSRSLHYFSCTNGKLIARSFT